MANNTDTILAIVYEEGARDGASSVPPQPDRFIVSVNCWTRGYAGTIEVAIDPNLSASQINSTISTAVASKIGTEVGRSFAAVNVRLLGGAV